MQKENKKKILGTVPKKLQFIETFWDYPEFLKKEQKNSTGITLIALIITIIVMLILVGVSVTVALKGGLFSSAKDATGKTQIERDKELALDGGTVEVNDVVYDSMQDYIDKKPSVATGTPIGATDELKAKQVQVGELVYVANADGKTATVYGYRGDVDYSNSILEAVTIEAKEIQIAKKVEISEKNYTVSTIGKYAFYGMRGAATELESVTIPDTITNIGDWAFNSCAKLAQVTDLSSVTSIGGAAFTGTAWLTAQRTETTNGLVIVNDILIDGATTTVENITEQMLNNVIEISGYAFHMNTSIKSIAIPNTVTSIGAGAFQMCGNLVQISIPSSLINVGNSSTYNGTLWATNQKESGNGLLIINGILIDGTMTPGDISIPNTVNKIANGAFSMVGATSITIPSSVTTVESGAIGTMAPSLTTINVSWEEGSKPAGWADDWNGSGATITYNYNPES